jgi:hypothetical protein
MIYGGMPNAIRGAAVAPLLLPAHGNFAAAAVPQIRVAMPVRRDDDDDDDGNAYGGYTNTLNFRKWSKKKS